MRYKNNIGPQVRRRRYVLGWSQSVLAAKLQIAGFDTSRIRRLGVPDRFIEHAERGELMADLGLDYSGILRACRELAESRGVEVGVAP